MGVILSGHFEVPADRLDALRAALPAHIRLTRAEPGCLAFDIIEDPARPGRFEVYEEFIDADAFRAHQRRADAAPWGRVSLGLTRHYTVTGLTP
ncbi:MAG: antibiotic biosynthesis monooxygenase [Rhodobacteraceae bacterium]|nr:antibiotic biosynthesis monooxygenase [Paracoccaceae bacterium]